MSLAATIKHHLNSHDVAFRTITRGAAAAADAGEDRRVPLTKTVKSIILRDRDGLLIAVMAADRALDIGALREQLKRNIEVVPPRDHITLFSGWGPGSFTPFARNYGLRMLVDADLAEQDCMYFETGNPDEYFRVERADFLRLHKGAQMHLRFTGTLQPAAEPVRAPEPATHAAIAQPAAVAPTSTTMKFRIQKITELPPMPEMAQKIFSLNANPYARVQDLAAIVELDPSLSAQIIRYARSPFFGYRGRIGAVQEAIARVLGYDLVMNIALGLAAAAPFRIARDGPLGLDAFWRHATYSAMLGQSLSSACTRGARPRQGLAYLAGLLHNFGFLLLGHLYPAEFKRLNDAVAAQPDVAVTTLERDIIGTSHTEIGLWLMEAWNMPGEVIATVGEHHNAAYEGNHASYVHLVRLVDHILRQHQLGDADGDTIPPELMQRLGLTQMQIDTKFNKLIESRDELDSIARTLAA